MFFSFIKKICLLLVLNLMVSPIFFLQSKLVFARTDQDGEADKPASLSSRFASIFSARNAQAGISSAFNELSVRVYCGLSGLFLRSCDLNGSDSVAADSQQSRVPVQNTGTVFVNKTDDKETKTVEIKTTQTVVERIIERVASPVQVVGVTTDFVESRIAELAAQLRSEMTDRTVTVRTSSGSDRSSISSKQIDSIYEDMGDNIDEAIANLTILSEDEVLALIAANGSASLPIGTAGYVLQATATSSQWVATSTLGLSGGTGDWTGTFDGQASSFYLARGNHTGTQAASTISDFSSVARGLFSTTATGLTYTSGTGVLSLTSGFTIPTTASTTAWNNLVSSQWVTNGANISYSSGNVGIGTTTPGYALTVAGDISLTGALRASGNAGTNGYVLQTTGSGVQWVATSSLGFGGSIDLDALSVIEVGSGNTSTGGSSSAIGYQNTATSTFASAFGTFNMATAAKTSAFGYFNTASAYYASAFGSLSDATGQYSSAFGHNANATGDGSVAVGYYVNATAPNAYVFGGGITNNISDSVMIGPSSSAAITILSTGNVGIGTSSPIAGLHVYSDDTYASKFESTGYDNYNQFTSTAGTGEYGIWNDALYFQALDDLASGIQFFGSQNGGVDLQITSSGNVGVSTTTPDYAFTVAGDISLTGALRASGNAGTNGMVLQTTGSGVQWVATSTLGISGPALDVNALGPIEVGNANTATGTDSTAIGYSNEATGILSAAFGGDNIASGDYSSAFGLFNTSSGYMSSAFGYDNTSSSYYTTAFGYSNVASSFRAVASGYDNDATGSSATASGYSNTASANYSSAIGHDNLASGTYASAFGFGVTATGTDSVAFGNRSSANTINSSVFGSRNFTGTTGISSVVMGILNNSHGATFNSSNGVISGAANATSSVGIASTAVGIFNRVVGDRSSAFGLENIITNINNTAVGYGNVATGISNAAFGYQNSTALNYSTAVGYQNTASGNVSMTLGYSNSATGVNSNAIGFDNTASNTESFAIGRENNVSAIQAYAFGSGITNNITTSLMIGPSNISKATILSTGEFRAPFFSATSTTATSTFAGGLTVTGNVGIGTTTPSASLAITGNAAVANIFSVASSTQARIFSVTSTGEVYLQNSSGALIIGEGTGNSRGTNALDVQSFRATAAAVAGGSRSVAVGYSNTASASDTVSVGSSNSASLSNAVAIGRLNTSSGSAAIAMGYGNTASAGSTVAIGASNTASASGAAAIGIGIVNNVANSLQIGPSNTSKITMLTSGNVGFGTTTPGYALTVAGDLSVTGALRANGSAGTSGFILQTTGSAFNWVATSTLGFLNASGLNSLSLIEIGNSNFATGTNASALGYGNTASGYESSASGNYNTASGYRSSAFGWSNIASAGLSFAAGSANNTSDTYAVAVGGANTSSGYQSASFGNNNTAGGYRSVAIGSYVANNTAGYMVFGTGVNGAGGNVTFSDYGRIGIEGTDPAFTGVSISTASGAYLSLGGTWTNSSSRSLKENGETVDKQETLEKISQLSIEEWNYIKEGNDVRHIGPYAEDFFELFGLGGSNKTVSSIDPAGVALIGIQALKETMDSFVDYVEDGIAYVNELVVKRFTARQITVENEDLYKTGVTIYDQKTGEPICMFVYDGDIQTEPGKCEDREEPQEINDPVEESPEPEAPAQDDTQNPEGGDSSGNGESSEGVPEENSVPSDGTVFEGLQPIDPIPSEPADETTGEAPIESVQPEQVEESPEPEEVPAQDETPSDSGSSESAPSESSEVPAL